MTRNKAVGLKQTQLSRLWSNRTIRIFVDVSDTIALPPIGNNVFDPHEIALKEIVSEDEAAMGGSNTGKTKFLLDAKTGLKHFDRIKRDNSINILERYKVWLDPFIGKLRKSHFIKLVQDWRLQTNFLEGIRILREKFNLPDNYPLEIVSGNLVDINEAFVTRPDIADILRLNNISFPIGEIQGIKLEYSKDGIYEGYMNSNGTLYYSDHTEFPKQCLTIGDDAMEKYGFGPFLINVQSFNEGSISNVVQEKLSESSLNIL